MLDCKTEDQRIAAVLHDTVEDCGLELSLIQHRFGLKVAAAVDHLSRRDGEDYPAFINRCGANEIARVVKLADLSDNMNLDRLGRKPTIEDYRRHDKYLQARAALKSSASQSPSDSPSHKPA